MTVEIITGNLFNVADAILAVQLDGKGGWIPISEHSIASEQQPFWIHLNYQNKTSQHWLQNCQIIPDTIRNEISGATTRPRASRIGDDLLITLRSVNFNSEHFPDPLVALRIYISKSFIITSRLRPIASVDKVYNDLNHNHGPLNCGDWLADLTDELIDHTSDFIDQLQEKIVGLENRLLGDEMPERGELALIRKQLIILRRHLLPQRDVLSKIANEKINWIESDDRRNLQDIAERLGRGIDDLDAGIARTTILSDEVSSMLAEQTNNRAYTLSILAAIFLPATLLTGLFGVNLGGIPGADNPFAFVIFCVFLVIIGVGFGWWLKRRNWF